MFDHLITASPEDDFVPEEDVAAVELLDAKYRTVKLLESLNGTQPDAAIDEAERATAQTAFATMVGTATPEEQRKAIVSVSTPEAVKHLVGMLTAYDWKFVEQAQELRSYTVSKIVEETSHPDARIRLRALEMLGRVTEVALFTDRVEVKHTQITDSELEEQLRAKLGRVFPAEYAEVEENADPSPSA